MATFFVRCPVTRLRDTARAGTSPFIERLRSEPARHAQYLIAAGRNVVELVEVVAAWEDGDLEGPRRLREKALRFSGHAPDQAVEDDLLRHQVAELLPD